MQKVASACLALALQASAASLVPLPQLKGPYKVGTSALELVDSSRIDPFAPTTQSRKLAISLFYPTEETEDCTLALQFQPLTAAYIDKVYQVSLIDYTIDPPHPPWPGFGAHCS